jgi:hypothetical protein
MKYIYKQIGGLRGIALGALEVALFFLAAIACGLAFVAVV